MKARSQRRPRRDRVRRLGELGLAGRKRTEGAKRLRRSARLECLEPRLLLSANSAPELGALDHVVVYGGAPLHIALDAFDADGDELTFEVISDNPDLVEAVVPQGNRSLRFSVEDFGEMTFELFEDLVPGATARIIELAEDGFYDGLTFHRIIDDFMIQGGDPNGDGTGGSGTTFDDEFHPLLQHTSPGVLSMAKGGDDTNDSQFFITDRATRHLDFNHTVFGFLSEGDDVRNAIQSVETDDQARPTSDVVIDGVTVFHDTENGVLRLIAPDGATGSAEVTVIVRDGQGGETTQTFQVQVAEDPVDNYPFLDGMDPIELAYMGETTLQIPAIDVDGGDIYYWAAATGSKEEKLTVTVDNETGELTITAEEGLVGVAAVWIGVRAQQPADYFEGRDVWDTQMVPVLVAPPAPSGIELTASSDTGSSSSDGLTNRDNSADSTLRFRVYGVVPGAEVAIFADGEEIGRSVTSVDPAVIETNGDVPLDDGTHEITAIQFLKDVPVDVGNTHTNATIEGEVSEAFSITVDTDPPVITTTAPTDGAVGRLYEYDLGTSEEEDGSARYRLVQSPSGMVIQDLNDGVIRWTPSESQVGSHEVIVEATDAAGNSVQQQFTIEVTAGPKLLNVPSEVVSILEGSLLEFDFDVEGDESRAPFVFSIDDPVPEGVAIDPDTGAFTWQTDETHGPGSYSMRIRVTDDIGASTSRLLRVYVREHNQAPTLQPIDNVVLKEGEALEIQAEASDADIPENLLVYSLGEDAPEGMTVGALSGRIRWEAGELDGGKEYEVTLYVRDRLEASDPNVQVASQTFRVTVLEVDDPPIFGEMPALTAVPGQTLRWTVTAEDPDVPTNEVAVEAVGSLPDGASFDPDTGEFVWTIPQNGEILGGTVVAFRAVEQSDEALSATAELNILVIDPRAVTAPMSELPDSEPIPRPQPNDAVFSDFGASGEASIEFAALGTAGELPVDFQLLDTGVFSRVGSAGVIPGEPIRDESSGDNSASQIEDQQRGVDQTQGSDESDQSRDLRSERSRQQHDLQSGEQDAALDRVLAMLLVQEDFSDADPVDAPGKKAEAAPPDEAADKDGTRSEPQARSESGA